MSQATHNFDIVAGHTWEVTFQYKHGNGSPVDLTGLTPRMQIRKLDNTLVLSANSSQVFVSNAATGHVQIDIAASVTATFQDNNAQRQRYRYAIELYDETEVQPFLTGDLVVQRNVIQGV